MINELEENTSQIHNDQAQDINNFLLEHNKELQNEGKEPIDKAKVIESFIIFQKYFDQNKTNDNEANTIIINEQQQQKSNHNEDNTNDIQSNNQTSNAINESKEKKNSNSSNINTNNQSKSCAVLKGQDENSSRNKNNSNCIDDHDSNKQTYSKQLLNSPSHLNYLNEPLKPVVPIALSIKKDYNNFKPFANCSSGVFNKESNTKEDHRFKYSSVEPKKKVNCYQPFSLKKIHKVESNKKTYECDNMTVSEGIYAKRVEKSKNKNMHQSTRNIKQKENKQKHKYFQFKNPNKKSNENFITLMVK